MPLTLGWPLTAKHSPCISGVPSLLRWLWRVGRAGQDQARSTGVAFSEQVGPHRTSSYPRRFWQSAEYWVKVLTKVLKRYVCVLWSTANPMCGCNLICILDTFFPSFYLEQLLTYGKVKRIAQRTLAYPSPWFNPWKHFVMFYVSSV